MATNEEKLIQISKNDLPLACPLEEFDDWDGHPRVYCKWMQKEQFALIAAPLMK